MSALSDAAANLRRHGLSRSLATLLAPSIAGGDWETLDIEPASGWEGSGVGIKVGALAVVSLKFTTPVMSRGRYAVPIRREPSRRMGV
jgi:hypothetical protein